MRFFLVMNDDDVVSGVLQPNRQPRSVGSCLLFCDWVWSFLMSEQTDIYGIDVMHGHTQLCPRTALFGWPCNIHGPISDELHLRFGLIRRSMASGWLSTTV